MSASSSNKSGKIPKPSFVSRNLVAIVMIPSIIAIHYGWSLMQENRTLVSENEKIDQPIVTLAKYGWNRILGNKTGNSDAVPSVTAAK